MHSWKPGCRAGHPLQGMAWALGTGRGGLWRCCRVSGVTASVTVGRDVGPAAAGCGALCSGDTHFLFPLKAV